MAYELILQAYGWERGWEVITTMGANVRNFTSGGSQAPKDVAAGEVAYGLSIDFYAWAQVGQVGEDYIGFTMPDNLTIVNPDRGGHPERRIQPADGTELRRFRHVGFRPETLVSEERRRGRTRGNRSEPVYGIARPLSAVP